MKCQESIILISGRLDGELTPEQELELEKHLETCELCRKEFEELSKLKEVTADMRFTDLPDRYWAGYWNDIYNRLERGLGWIFVSISAIIILGFGAWELFNEFLMNQAVPILLRFGVGAGIIGLVILLVSVFRERLFAKKHERYEEVER